MWAIFVWFIAASACASRVKPRQPIGITGEGVGKDLQSHITIELRVVGPVYLSHPSFADLRGDFVDAEA